MGMTTSLQLLCLVPSVSDTVWSIGHLVYPHSKKMFDKFCVRLGINTMKGREAKHVQIASYARNSLFKQRWSQVFRHDYINKLWLPVQQPSLFVFHQSHDTLIRTRVFKDPQHYCYCGMPKDVDAEQCYFCGDHLIQETTASVPDGKQSPECLRYCSYLVREITNGFKLRELDPNYVAGYVLQTVLYYENVACN